MSENNVQAVPRKKLFLIDGSSYIYRAFFALPYLSNSKGLPTNAVYGFTSMLLKVIREKNPDYLAVTFDAKGPTFRHEVYKEYKANRSAMPDALIPQIPYIHRVVEGFNLPVLMQQGVEADDIIGTMAKKAEDAGIEVIIITGDKDMMQLVSPNVTILDTMKDITIDADAVRERFGVTPERVIDFLGLMGDSSDNIPGVPGVGEKTAKKLLTEYGSMDNLYSHIGEIKGKLREKLEDNRDLAYLSRELATIRCELDFEVKTDELTLSEPDTGKLRELFKELELSRFLKDLAPRASLSREDYHLLMTLEEIKSVLERVNEETLLSIDLETTSLNTQEAEIVGISLSFKAHEAFYIPMGHSYDEAPEQPALKDVLDLLRPILNNGKIRKTGHNLKYDFSVFKKYDESIKGIYCDTMIASYLLNPTRHSHSLDEVSREYLDHEMMSYKEVVGDPKKVTFDQVSINKALVYAAEDADAVYLLSEMLLPKLESDGFTGLFHQVEMPLLEVLAEMEMTGVKIDSELLGRMSSELNQSMDKLISRIYEIAGEEFNINSPKQLAVILFEKLNLPKGKKTKTGYSTNNEVLTNLAEHHELPSLILEYRSLAKLKSTYIDALPKMINERTGRVHTSYNQTVTATGRLSSSNPNLQNIPIKTDLGKKIREAFIPEKGSSLIAADYSQVELRIMAHLSGDDVLIQSFSKGEDIHRRTASDIFGIFPALVTDQMRREAKVVNFGIMYGMGPFSLSKELGVSLKVAKAYIEGYFDKYKAVKDFMNASIESTREKGYVTTIMNRRCYIPEINAGNMNQRQFAERVAINAPIQGSAADIIKVAMVNIFRRLNKEGLKSKMIMQVHDELVFEVPENETDIMQELIREEMEGVVQLKAPLLVDIGIGRNWAEAH
ncbi:MAG: DNA polymerase I [Proteobacteria bacterium]|nr:DNA polymerase I [Pseudomonadota bacterium]